MITLKKAQSVLDNASLIYDATSISNAIDKMASDIEAEVLKTNDDPLPVIVISVMNGGLILAGHLLTRLNIPVHVDFIHATRYRNQTSGGDLEWKVEPHQSINNRRVLIVDDILDEGFTLDEIVNYCRSQGVRKVWTAVLVKKNHPRLKADINSDFVGLMVEDRYVFGFGMDYKGYHRNLNAIYAAND
ncbi:MAG: hypoxanthine-guanine phosphoribosyltransferase [Gammaproteobacteria bacterium]|nr:hypoxanthine-guanine phosphoribosyltransferase [Gammaproteobacteria bacterium]MDH5735641.1 hypoxanthine-guanine phosphoribosyltransferase [Gammaproteobacteria bacterium]